LNLSGASSVFNQLARLRRWRGGKAPGDRPKREKSSYRAPDVSRCLVAVAAAKTTAGTCKERAGARKFISETFPQVH
jgi:hypothetical protein